MTTPTVRKTAEAAKAASRVLATLDEPRRNAALHAMADALAAAGPELFAANAQDLALAQTFTGADKLSPATLSRLTLDPAKLAEMVDQIRSVAALPDPLGRILAATELDDTNPPTLSQPGPTDTLAPTPTPTPTDLSSRPKAAPFAAEVERPAVAPAATSEGLHLQKVPVPLGVLAVIFEARPDAVTQIASLALKSGNAVILKPGREVEHTAVALVRLLRDSLAAQNLPPDALSLVLGRERVHELLTLHTLVDMVIPRGSKALVEFVQNNTRIPVLGHSEGVCHIFVDRAADPTLALRVIADAKTDYPAACNAVETVLVHRDLAPTFIPALAAHMASLGVTVHADSATRELLLDTDGHPVDSIHDWHTEYGGLAFSLGIVDSLDAAVRHIHAHGSSHTESILTEDPIAADRFLREVDAAGVFHNVSTRFADGFRYGFGAEVGISTSKFHARGPVGLEGLTTYKYILRGHGHIVGDYRGPHARSLTHRREGI